MYRRLFLISILLVSANSIYNMTSQDKLLWGASSDFDKLVEEALKEGIDVNLKDCNGLTALMIAADKGSGEIVKTLLNSGANVNLQDNDGWTALMYVSRKKCHYGLRKNNMVNIAKMLIEAGAYISTKNNQKQRAIDLANGKEYNEIAQMLQIHKDHLKQHKNAWEIIDNTKLEDFEDEEIEECNNYIVIDLEEEVAEECDGFIII